MLPLLFLSESYVLDRCYLYIYRMFLSIRLYVQFSSWPCSSTMMHFLTHLSAFNCLLWPCSPVKCKGPQSAPQWKKAIPVTSLDHFFQTRPNNKCTTQLNSLYIKFISKPRESKKEVIALFRCRAVSDQSVEAHTQSSPMEQLLPWWLFSIKKPFLLLCFVKKICSVYFHGDCEIYHSVVYLKRDAVPTQGILCVCSFFPWV